jgi:lambda repressor-like predicted transcriptional regulator
MEYQIRYSGVTGSGPGSLTIDEQKLRLKGYTAARQRGRMLSFLWVIYAIWMTVWFVYLGKLVENFLGLPPQWIWTDLILLGLMLAPFPVIALVLGSWPGSNNQEEFEKQDVSRVGGRGKRVYFCVPNPLKSGKLLYIQFKAKSSVEAEQIAEALGIIKVEHGTHELSNAAELASTVSISPDLKRDIFSGRLSMEEIGAKCGVSAGQLRDILSAQYSKDEIMIKYALGHKELDNIYKTLKRY